MPQEIDNNLDDSNNMSEETSEAAPETNEEYNGEDIEPASEHGDFEGEGIEIEGEEPEPEPEAPSKVKRQAEKTLMIDSTLLQAIEEANGEIEETGSKKHQYIPIIASIGGVVIVVVIILALVLGGNSSDSENNGEGNAASAAGAAASSSDKTETAAPAPYYDEIPTVRGRIETDPSDAYITVNGVLGTMEQRKVGYDFFKYRYNVVTAYSEGYVPRTVFIPKDYDFKEPISVVLESAELYQTGEVSVELEDSRSYVQTTVKFNGKPLNIPAKIKMVKGVPNQLLVEREGMGSHLHIIYPHKDVTEVVIPALQSKSNADRFTVVVLSLPKDLQKQEDYHSFKLDMLSDNEKHSKSGRFTIGKGNYVFFDFAKEGRYPLKYVVNTTPFGSVTMEADMALSSLGTAEVQFKMDPSMKDVQVCFRRPGDVYCPEMKGVSNPASGSWEIIAYREVNGYKKLLKGTFKDNMVNKTAYVLKVLPAGADGFRIQKESQRKLKK